MIPSGFIARVLQPRRRQLILFGILLLPFISYGLWHTSFTVNARFIYLYELLIGAGLVAWLVLFLVDRYVGSMLMFASNLRSYPISGMIAFIILLILELPIHAGLQTLSDRDGDKIRRSVEEFHKYNGYYPDDLSDSGFDHLSRRSWTFSFYRYDRGLEPYRVRYKSIGGRERFYSHQYQMWTFPFDE